MGDPIHFQLERQDLQFFLCVSALSFGREPSQEKKKFRVAQESKKIAIIRISHLYCLAL